MLFDVNSAKQKVLQELVRRDWTASELAEELGKSSNAVYNHLNALYEHGVVSKEKLEGKTRPRTSYSIENGFVHYIAVLPDLYEEKSIELTERKEVLFRTWSLPQEKLHPFVEEYWRMLPQEKINAMAVYGSVARGEASEESDIDIIILVEDEEDLEDLEGSLATQQITVDEETRLVMSEIYTEEDYNQALENSQFIKNIQEEIHTISDPNRTLRKEDNP